MSITTGYPSAARALPHDELALPFGDAVRAVPLPRPRRGERPGPARGGASPPPAQLGLAWCVDGVPVRDPESVPARVPERGPGRVPQRGPARVPPGGPTRVPEPGAVRVPERGPGRVPERGPARVPPGGPAKVPERGAARVPERGPVRDPERGAAQVLEGGPARGGTASDGVPARPRAGTGRSREGAGAAGSAGTGPRSRPPGPRRPAPRPGTAPTPRAAVGLLRQAAEGLAEAHGLADPLLRYPAAYLSALRAGAAVLAVRAAPQPKRGAARNVWALLADVAPELGEWAAFFASCSRTRAAAEAGIARLVGQRDADDLLRQAEQFLGVVQETVVARS